MSGIITGDVIQLNAGIYESLAVNIIAKSRQNCENDTMFYKALSLAPSYIL